MLTNYLSEKFLLTKTSTKNLIKGILWSLLHDMTLIIPMILYMTLLYLLIQQHITPTLHIYIIPIIVVSILITYTYYKQYYYVYNTTYDSSIERRITLAENIRLLPLSFFEKKDLSDLSATIMNDCTDLEHVFSHAIPQLSGSIILIILITIGMLIYNPILTISLLWVVPVSFAGLYLSKKIQEKNGTKVVKASRKVSNTIQDGLDSIREIQSYNYTQTYYQKIRKETQELKNTHIKTELVSGSFVTLSQMILKLGVITLLITAISLYTRNEVNIYTLIIFVIAATNIFSPLEIALTFVAEIFLADTKISRMKEIEEQIEPIKKETYHLDNYEIKFHNVNFAYDNKQVLKNITFTAKQNQITALIGPSGSGKSTISKLAAKLLSPTSGVITLGKTDINTINTEKILENYSIVFQDVILFNNTIKENIRIGRKDASDEEIYQAAHDANCIEFIEKLPEGYETNIGENGVLLSGGERQRIAIARALLKDAPIVILDEATSSLDVENETKIQEALNKLLKNKTVIIIAHRMRTIQNADKLVVIDKGQIIEEGNPRELYAKNGLFTRMVDIQAKTNTWTIK
ncbi:ABC transporter ATP-binding protein [Methanosphaera sp. WGK6]|uniref:ABC transporter ATP-binding protein n=1 Tax=Methanosphaera sp. WGK6 TaxID=1561964 RepID=UPI00084C2955|nr:ABC transporter ATP-binding protein [Methanosphaera sp. WGK6]OED30411.1 ABC transporter ATP-binding protein [Methanosphaera sp. WGK6]